MASNNNDGTVRYKCLSSINLGGNHVRFLGVNEDNRTVHFPQSVNECPGRLLFLASDVLTGTNVAKKNQARVHSRYSRTGNATKLILNGFKVEGINNSGTMWFYSVQGLFHVVFEMGSRAAQKDCLLHLQDVWLERFKEPLLIPEGHLQYNKCLNMEGDSYCILMESPPVDSRDVEENDALIDCANVTDQKRYDCDKSNQSEIADEENGGEQEECHETVDSVECTQKWKSKLCQIDVRKDETKCKILQLIDELTSHVTCFYTKEFHDIIHEFLLLLKQDTSELVFDNLFGLSRDKYVFLYVLSDWLGKQFHDLEPQIVQKVDLFKKLTLQTIDNLPPAEKLIDLLFPHCMKILLVNWLGEAQCREGFKSDDHCYTPPAKVQKMSIGPNYTVVQLMLEFGTNCLISGIAHVVYSRLHLQNSDESKSRTLR